MNYRRKYMQMVAISVISLLLMTACAALMMVAISTRPKPERMIIHEYHECADSLDEWQLFTMALIEIESENKSSAISHRNARGILQETDIYIEDVNRITGWNLSPKDAHDDSIALLCFRVYQQHYNPELNINKAIKIHNPGAGGWYAKRIKAKKAEITRREQIRKLIINQ